MEINKFYNEDCKATMERMVAEGMSCDVILTSPPYNTSRKNTGQKSIDTHSARYDVYFDLGSQEDYLNWCVELFNMFDKVLNKDGVVLWNVSYGNDTQQNTNGVGTMFLSIAKIMQESNFTIADRITWKKGSALPNNVSPNKLTRIVEDVYVFVRKSEFKTFKANKEVSSVRENGQKMYKNYFNFIEARNNDGSNKLNKATFSSDLVRQLLGLYAPKGSLIYDPFMGTGTTAKGALEMGCKFIGSEISTAQVEYSIDRLKNEIVSQPMAIDFGE